MFLSVYTVILRNLNKGVFERRTSTGSEDLICLDGIKFVVLSFFTLV